jgi:hypothetical protein
VKANVLTYPVKVGFLSALAVLTATHVVANMLKEWGIQDLCIPGLSAIPAKRKSLAQLVEPGEMAHWK